MNKTKPRILVTRKWPAAVENCLQESFAVSSRDTSLNLQEWHEAFRSFDAICPCICDRITPDVYPASGIRTRLLANYGVGYNHIDLEAAKSHGIQVSNTPGVLTEATADLAMTLMLMLARRAGEGERQLRAGEWGGWYPTHMMGAGITGASLGIVGMGRIGLALAHRAHHGFGMKILYHNRKPVDDPAIVELEAEYFSELDDMLGQADFVSLHCPGGPATFHLMDTGRLAAMQKHAFLINTSRGDVVDEEALVLALQEHWIAGAGLDVYELEPRVNAGLLHRDDVVLLPHLGSATRATRTAMGLRVKANLEAFFNGQQLPDRIA